MTFIHSLKRRRKWSNRLWVKTEAPYREEQYTGKLLQFIQTNFDNMLGLRGELKYDEYHG